MLVSRSACQQVTDEETGIVPLKSRQFVGGIIADCFTRPSLHRHTKRTASRNAMTGCMDLLKTAEI